jgi:hypothetical protein
MMSSSETKFASIRELRPEELENVGGGWASRENYEISLPNGCLSYETRPGTYIWDCPNGFGDLGW